MQRQKEDFLAEGAAKLSGGNRYTEAAETPDLLWSACVWCVGTDVGSGPGLPLAMGAVPAAIPSLCIAYEGTGA